MIKNITAFLAILTVSAWALSSCRPLGDDLVSCGQNDQYAFSDANASFAGEFKAFWYAMNENYGIWDYEEAHGVNWDEVYTTFLPKFEALDDTANRTNVTDAEFKALYSQFIDSLHDGHLYLEIKNLDTRNIISFFPAQSRNLRERREVFMAEKNNVTDLAYYKALPITDRYYAGAVDATSSSLVITENIDTVCSRIIMAADNYIALVDNAGGPNSTNDSVYVAVKSLKALCQDIRSNLDNARASNNYLKQLVTTYNNMCSRYDIIGAQLDVDMPYVETDLANDKLKYIVTALFKGNIAYLRLGAFALSSYLPREVPEKPVALSEVYHQAVTRVWSCWFDTIQSLHQSGQLEGVIIDLRNNGGGALNDYQFVLGALLPSDRYESHSVRVKNGTGRLDFSPIMPFNVPTYSKAHAVVSDRPIVVLANTHSVSMSEVTTWGVISQPNGYFIGTRTWGGLSALHDDPAAYSETYSGGFGEYRVTPFYGYVPRYVSLFGEDKRILESEGIVPDLEVPLDVNLWQTLKRDNQLEAALDYIHSK